MRTTKADETRTRSIGSSTVPIIMGTCHYKDSSLHGVASQMIDGISKDFSKVGAIGHEFELPVMMSALNRFCELTGESPDDLGEMVQLKEDATFRKDIIPDHCFNVHEIGEMEKEHGGGVHKPIMSNATPDGFFLGDRDTGMEAKARFFQGEMLVGQEQEYFENLPGRGNLFYGDELSSEILPSDYDQSQWHMRCSGMNRIIFGISLGIEAYNKTRVYIIKRDSARIREIERAVCKFHWSYIMPFYESGLRRYPPVDGSEWCRLAQNSRVKHAGESIQLSAEMDATARELMESQAKAKLLEGSISHLKNKLREGLDGAWVALSDGYKVTNRPTKKGNKTLRVTKRRAK